MLKSKKSNLTKSTIKKSYIQASKLNIEDIIHIKYMFLTLTSKKIVEISNIINKSNIVKSKIKITTKKPSRKQIIIFMSENSTNIIGSDTSFYINIINIYLKETNSNNMINFLCKNKVSIIITTSQTIFAQDIRTIKKAIKNSEKINKNFIRSS